MSMCVPGGEAFAVARDGKGLEELIERLRTLSPQLIAVEATGCGRRWSRALWQCRKYFKTPVLRANAPPGNVARAMSR
jgi:hypothetical protein